MKIKFITIAAILGALAVVLGALAAHKLKAVLTASSLDAFDKGVKYQMYHVLLLIIVAMAYKPAIAKEIKQIGFLLIAGICLFSFSIYLLSTQAISHINFSFLGPITPLGGLCMIAAWILLAVNAKKIFQD